MITDIVLLRALSKLDIYNLHRPSIDIESLQPETAALIKGFGEFFSKVPITEINYPIFFDWFVQYLHPGLTDTQYKYYKLILENVAECTDDLVDDLVIGLKTRQLRNNVQELLTTGFSPDRLEEALNRFKGDVKKYDERHEWFVSNDIDDILAGTDRTGGLNFRMKWLAKNLPPLIKGDLAIIAGYVNLGKTTFAMSEATYMAQQMTEGCLLWLNNEQKERLVQKRLWQSALEFTKEEFEGDRGRAQDLYRELMNGDINRIRVVNIYNKTFDEVSALIRRVEPKLVVIDRADKINIPKMHNNPTYQQKGRVAADLRQLAKEVCPIIGIVQASANVKYFDAHEKRMKYIKYPDQEHIHDTKVDLPGEADIIIMIGGDNESPNIRGVHVCKNKEGQSFKFDALFDGQRVRYRDPG